jgi:subfamily B ATP-binding cassette protein MsbA
LGVTLRRLTAYSRAQRVRLVAAVALFFASSAIDPLLPAFFKWLIDNGFKSGLTFPLWLVPLAIVGLFVVRGLLGFGGAYLFARATSDAARACTCTWTQRPSAAGRVAW